MQAMQESQAAVKVVGCYKCCTSLPAACCFECPQVLCDILVGKVGMWNRTQVRCVPDCNRQLAAK